MPPSRRTIRGLTPAALAGLLIGGCGATSQHFTVRHAPLASIFEAPLELMSTPGPTLDLLRRLGVENVRVVVRWSSLAPGATSTAAPAGFGAASPAAYPAAAWAPYDAIVRDAKARGIGVLMDVSGPAPLWATGRGAPRGGTPGVWKPSAAMFRPFVRAVGLRYSGHYTPPGSGSRLPRVSFWSIWNEPNLGQQNLAPQAGDNSAVEESPGLYRGLLDAGWSALQDSGHGGDTNLIGELAPYGQAGPGAPGTFGEMVPLRFLRALYCVDASLRPLQGAAAVQRGCPTTASASKSFAHDHPALFQASGFAIHPYANLETTPPNVVIPMGPDFVYLATLPRFERVLDAVTQLYGSSKRFPIYSTEYGYRTNPPSPLALSPPLAAAYLNWAEYLTWRNPRLRSWDQYLLVDPPTGGASQFTTGLEFFGGQLKPSYVAWRMPIFLPVTQQRHGHGLEVWGCVRPAHYAKRNTLVQIQLQAAGGGRFQTVTTVPITDPSGYFDTAVRFPSGGQVRLSWTYPHGPTIHSRQVSIRVG